MSTRNRDSFRLSTSKSVYDEFFPEDIAEQGLLNGTLFKGVLRVAAQKRNIAYVTAEKAKIDVCIDNENLRNRSVNDDTVIIQLLPESEWTTPLKTSSLTAIIDGINSQPPKNANETNQKLWKPRSDLSSKRPSAVTEISDPLKTLHPIDESAQRTTLQPRGKVVFVYPRSKPVLLVGSLDGSNNNIQLGCKLPKSAPYVFFRPSDNKYPSFIINRLDIPEAYVNDPFNVQKQIFLAELSPVWPTDSKMPFGCNVRSIGEVGSIQAETEALLLEHGLHHNYFENEVVAPLKKLLGSSLLIDTSSREVNWNIPADEITKRRDLRHYRIFTIDPSNAKDLDDALHITPLGHDIYEIGVHIADVSYFIPENTPLDLEARKRATSVYLVQKVIPMLPPILCEQLCSLNPNVDRLAFSVIWKMHGDGTLTDDEPWFGRTVIRCCAKLDYSTAQKMIDGIIPSEGTQNNIHDYLSKISEDIWESSRRPSMTSSFSFSHALWDIAKDVCVLNSIAMQRRAVRLENGAIALHQPKLTFLLDVHGNPAEVQTYNIRQSNKLVEEYMLLANYLVAQQLVQKASRAAFLRRHPAPSNSGLEELEKLAQHIGISIDTSSAESLQKGLSELTNTTDELVTQAVTCLMMKPMKPAEYFVVNDVRNPDYWNHYALAIPYYTHFTSPIRRYADIEVHRLLTMTLQPQPLLSPSRRSSTGGGNMEVQELVNEERIKILSMNAVNCNDMKLAAKYAQTRSSEVFFAIYLMNKPIDTEAIVLGIGPKTFTIYTPQFGLQSKLFVDEMTGVSHSFNDETKELTLSRRSTSSSTGHNTSNDKGKSRKSKGGGSASTSGGGGSSPKPSDHTQSTTLKFKTLTITLMSTIIVRISARTVPPPVALQFSLVGPSGNTLSQNDTSTDSPLKPHVSSTPQKELEEEDAILAASLANDVSLIDEGEQVLLLPQDDVKELNADNSASSSNNILETVETFTIEEEYLEEVVYPPDTATEVVTISPIRPPPPPPPRSSIKISTQETIPTVPSPSSPMSPTGATSSLVFSPTQRTYPPPPLPLPSKRTISSNISDSNSNNIENPIEITVSHGDLLVVEEVEGVNSIATRTRDTNISSDILDVVTTKKSGSVKLKVVIDDHDAKFENNDNKLPKAKSNVIEELTASMTVLTDTLKAITVEDSPVVEKSISTFAKEAVKDTLDPLPLSPRTSSSKASTTSNTTASKPNLSVDNKKVAAVKLHKKAPSAPAPTFSPMKPLHSNSFPDDSINKKHHHLSPNHSSTGNTTPSSRLTRSSSLGHKSPVHAPDLFESIAITAVEGHLAFIPETQGMAASTTTAHDKTEGSAIIDTAGIKPIKSPKGAFSKGHSESFASSPKHAAEKGKDKERKTSPLPQPHKAVNPPGPATTTTTTAVTSTSTSDQLQANTNTDLTVNQPTVTKTSAHPTAASSSAKSGLSKDTNKTSTITSTTITSTKTTSKSSLASTTAVTATSTTVTATKNSSTSRRKTLGGSSNAAAGHPLSATAAFNPLAEDDIIPSEVVSASASHSIVKSKPVAAGGGAKKPLPISGHDTDSSKLKSKAVNQSANATSSKNTLPKPSTSYAASVNSRKSILPSDTKSENGVREKEERKPGPPLKSRTKSSAALLTTSSTTTTTTTTVQGRKSLSSTQKVVSEKSTLVDVSKEKAVGKKQVLPPPPPATSTATATAKPIPKTTTNQPPTHESRDPTRKSEGNGSIPTAATSKSKQKSSSGPTSKHAPKIASLSIESTKVVPQAMESMQSSVIADMSVHMATACAPEQLEPIAATSHPLPHSSDTSTPLPVPPAHGATTGILEMKANSKKANEKKTLPHSSLPPKKLQGGNATTTTAPLTATTKAKPFHDRKSLMPSDTKSDGGGELKPTRKSWAPKVPPVTKGVIPPSATPAARRSLSTGRLGNLSELPPSTTTATAIASTTKPSTIKSTRTTVPVATPKPHSDQVIKLVTKNETEISTKLNQKPRSSMSSSSNNNNSNNINSNIVNNNSKPQPKPSVKSSKDKK